MVADVGKIVVANEMSNAELTAMSDRDPFHLYMDRRQGRSGDRAIGRS
ncbi:MAG: hypothetical protein HC860_24445 [Alkalinema sp. RU_4_3]|nr:hypothetical protein [Alkalinema sp. RU_4_3]